MGRSRLWVAGAALAAVVIPATGSAAAAPGYYGPSPSPPGPIADRQDPSAAPAFVGHAARARPVSKKTAYRPRIAEMHADAGNTDVTNFPGPLGRDPSVGSAQTLNLTPFMWGPDGSLTTGCVIPQPDATVVRCVGALDPKTLTFTARWAPPPGQVVNLAYLVMDGRRRVIASTMQGHIFVVQRTGGPSTGQFRLVRDIDLTGRLSAGETLLGATPDAAGRIWFTTGGILGAGDNPAPFTTLGYVTERGAVETTRLDDQIVENGFAVDDNTVYIVTGPAGAADHAHAVGELYAFRAKGQDAGITTAWQAQYDAGSARKPGGFARGSGATVTLVGTKYLTITDNADDRVSVLIYARENGRRVCREPIFAAGKSASDVSPIGVQNGDTSSVIVTNDYNAPPVMLRAADFNGNSDDMSTMGPGMARVDVKPGGAGCRTVWTNPLRMKTVPYLSSATGLIYTYTQDEQLAAQGQYVWYFAAIDYRTGRVVWRVRAGAGTLKNDNFSPMSIGPDGTLYQQVPFGVIWVKDGTGR